MATSAVQRHLTDRDVEILLALDRCPLTILQLLRLSQTFSGLPFTSPRSVQDRLQKLRAAGWLRRWSYATASRGGAPDYYKTTLLGFRLLYGERAVPPTKRHFAEVAIARHHHTHSLAEFIAHTVVASHRRGIHLANFYRENTLRLAVGGEALFPDCAFEIRTPDGFQLNFLVELDNGTERVRSDKDTDSWQRKIRLYEQLQDTNYPRRFRVLVVTTRSRERLDHILAMARAQARNPRRSLLYAVHLGDYLSQSDPLYSPCFRDHHKRPVALILLKPYLYDTGSARMSSPPKATYGNIVHLPVVTSPSPREPRSSGLPSPTS